MPAIATIRKVLARDGYRCRFCSCRVIVKEARNTFRTALPLAVKADGAAKRYHSALAVLTSSIDHVLPFRRGGDNGVGNLVTTCGPCQFGRGHWLLDEAKLEDPRKYAPVVDDWDGLIRVFATGNVPAMFPKR